MCELPSFEKVQFKFKAQTFRAFIGLSADVTHCAENLSIIIKDEEIKIEGRIFEDKLLSKSTIKKLTEY